ncbi:hypothetical protein [Sphingomonas sp.]|uniref:hypothetical protein n=1 Tax=Sphingomonas sp. TaxID=28214 RepID=UPI000BD3B135|nr:hypothetical protein [Sphingomonas sp.]MBA4762249.1 hypothetical protein [Sphingomonas sp.]OYX49914.1 MAG: hypothetical protein B7Y97_08365 [Sphingomonas sp. 32-66-10]
MKKILIVAAATGLMSLAACNTPAANNTAENVAAGMEAEADNMEMVADNATNEVVEDAAENAADNMEAAADNVAG